jgi:hypothetical protein
MLPKIPQIDFILNSLRAAIKPKKRKLGEYERDNK